MTKPRPISEEDSRKSKFAVAVLLGFLVAGVAVWSYLEFSSDLLVDRQKGMTLASQFEKECQASYVPNVCREVAGLNHASCFQKSATRTDDGVEYDVDVYRECMRNALDNHEAAIRR